MVTLIPSTAGAGAPPRPSRRASLFVGAAAVAAALAACTTVQPPPATPTPYPIRSPIAALHTSASPAPDGDTRRLLAQIQATARGGDPAAALRLLDQALATDPADPVLLAARAELRADQGDAAGAVDDLSSAIAVADGRADLLRARGRAFATLGDRERAERDWSRAISLEPGNPDAYVGRAALLTDGALGAAADYQRALDDLQRALAVAPDSVDARLARARLYLTRLRFRGDPSDTERALAELQALPPDRGGQRAALLRAEALAATGDHEAARSSLEAPVIATTADRPPAPGEQALAEARVASAARRWDAAAEAATAASRAPATALAGLPLLAEAELARGDPQAALAAADALLEQRPDDGVGWFLRGAALWQRNQRDDARDALLRARALLPDSPVYKARIDQRLGPAPNPSTPRPAA